MKQTILLLCILTGAFATRAQDEKKLVEAAVMDYVDAF